METIPVLLVTANVGSIFQDADLLLKTWVREFLLSIKKYQPQFVALHCQEVGGKDYEESMVYVEDFVRTLMASEELMNFGMVRVFLDEDFSCSEKFTALGNLYFVHNCVESVQIWDFQDLTFVPVVGKEVHSGNIEKVTTKEKAKFPREFFPECKWSRKGFMRTRWSINGTTFDLINIHLFHDASNLIAMETFPSSYTKNRRHALEYTIRRFQNDDYEKVPFFIFGDFNFRLDTKGVVQRLTNKAPPIAVKNPKNGDVVKVLYPDPANEKRLLVAVEKKLFEVDSHEDIFMGNRDKWLHDYDKELQAFKEHLYEYQINFHPSYPFKEDASGATSYMRTRCPSWCDRILLSKASRSLIYTDAEDLENPQVIYQLMGAGVCMGDHKPVMLQFRLQANMAGRRLSLSEMVNLPKTLCRRVHSTPGQLFLNSQLESHGSSHPQARRVVSESQALSRRELKKKASLNLPLIKSSRHTSHHSSSSEEWYAERNAHDGGKQGMSTEGNKKSDNSATPSPDIDDPFADLLRPPMINMTHESNTERNSHQFEGSEGLLILDKSSRLQSTEGLIFSENEHLISRGSNNNGGSVTDESMDLRERNAQEITKGSSKFESLHDVDPLSLNDTLHENITNSSRDNKLETVALHDDEDDRMDPTAKIKRKNCCKSDNKRTFDSCCCVIL